MAIACAWADLSQQCLPDVTGIDECGELTTNCLGKRLPGSRFRRACRSICSKSSFFPCQSICRFQQSLANCCDRVYRLGAGFLASLRHGSPYRPTAFPPVLSASRRAVSSTAGVCGGMKRTARRHNTARDRYVVA